MKKTLKEIEEEYDLELDKIIKTIAKEKAKNILLQFPDGMKPYSTTIVDYLESKTQANFTIWMGTCFGACDIPNTEDFDLIIQFGHTSWNYSKNKSIKILN